MEPTTQEVSIDETVKGKTKFGIDQVSNPSPLWTKWIFRVFFYLASITTVIVTTDDEISAQTAKRVAKYLAFATMAVHGASKLFGVKVDEEEFKRS
jgi:cytochrome bd-type quinol oxidase subunit 2